MLEELCQYLALCLWSRTTDRFSQLTTSLHEQQNRSLFGLTLNSPANLETKVFPFTYFDFEAKIRIAQLHEIYILNAGFHIMAGKSCNNK